MSNTYIWCVLNFVYCNSKKEKKIVNRERCIILTTVILKVEGKTAYKVSSYIVYPMLNCNKKHQLIFFSNILEHS